jgi:hypothetical protein
LGLGAFLIALAATIPATLITGETDFSGSVAVSGTVWSGTADLKNGDRVTWRTVPLASLLSLNLQSEFDVSGDLTQLKGRLSASPGKLVLSDISGVADWSLVRAAIPNAALECDLGVRVQEGGITFAGRHTTVSGEATTSGGTCRNRDGSNSFEAPPTSTKATASDDASLVRVVLASDPTTLFAEIVLDAAGGVKATVQPAALKLVPGANASGPVEYELRAG